MIAFPIGKIYLDSIYVYLSQTLRRNKYSPPRADITKLATEPLGTTPATLKPSLQP